LSDAPVVVTITAMTAADIPAVVGFGSGATPAQLEEELTRPWALPFVARDAEGNLVGFVLTWHVTDEVHILDVIVEPSVRRRGIGRTLMEHAIDRARERGSAYLYLEVRRSNVAAIHLYRTLGFRALGVRKKYYPDNEDAIEMTAALDPDTRAIVHGKDEVNLDRL
jgi:[ribosomal protein S18]-alanine N-acetyltransferase